MHYVYKIHKIDIFNYINMYILTQISLKSDKNNRHFT